MMMTATGNPGELDGSRPRLWTQWTRSGEESVFSSCLRRPRFLLNPENSATVRLCFACALATLGFRWHCLSGSVPCWLRPVA